MRLILIVIFHVDLFGVGCCIFPRSFGSCYWICDDWWRILQSLSVLLFFLSLEGRRAILWVYRVVCPPLYVL